MNSLIYNTLPGLFDKSFRRKNLQASYTLFNSQYKISRS